MLGLKEVLLYIVLIVVTYFFMELITDKNRKLSVVGAILVCCSSFIAYRGVPIAIIIGELAIIFLDKFFVYKNKALKGLFSVIILCTLWFYGKTYFLEYYSEYALNSFTRTILLTYLALAIWIMIKNTKELSNWKKIALSVLPILSTVAVFAVARNYYLPFTNDVLDLDNEKNGILHLFSYGYSMFLPFVDTSKNIAYSSFLSLFPLSLIWAMIYVYKKEKHLAFLMPMIIVTVIESILCMVRLTPLQALGLNINLYFDYVAGAIGLSCIYLYIYMFANIDENVFKQADSAKISIALLIFYFLVPRPEVFMSKGYMYAISAVITLLYFMFINFADKRYQKVLLVVLVLWSLISTVPVLFVN